ncbi:MAG TPA: N-acetyl-gamma-glutamyl-phosphate reductase [Terriglobales bacterium]|jgi:N-acetyl-gamma-glutamyl-phosphate reductase
MNKYSKASPRGQQKLRTGVVGATGYAGQELLNRLARHPGVELVAAMSSGRPASSDASPDAAVRVADLAPAYTGALTCTPASVAAMQEAGAEFVFLATPPEVSTEWVEGLPEGVQIVDLSGAYRFRDDVVYGWPEKNREAIQRARVVSNPGCYATAALTALWPLLKAGIIEADGIICDAKSGASGAGKGLRADLHFVELEANCKAYSVFTHRHAPEIARHAGMAGDGAASFIFTPHLLPTARGILATHYLRLAPGVEAAAIAASYDSAYAAEPFVRVRGTRLPELRDVNHTNYCDVGWNVRGRQVVVVTALDNLVKGAAGQALQNFNLMAGWPEATGLL